MEHTPTKMSNYTSAERQLQRRFIASAGMLTVAKPVQATPMLTVDEAGFDWKRHRVAALHRLRQNPPVSVPDPRYARPKHVDIHALRLQLTARVAQHNVTGLFTAGLSTGSSVLSTFPSPACPPGWGYLPS